MGVGAHALDELQGRPLATRIPRRALWVLAAVSIAGAVAIGIASAVAWTLWLLPLVAFGGFIVCAYNLELWGGLFHGDLWFGLAWGALPVLAVYVVMAASLDVAAGVAALAALLVSLAQRVLSTPVRAMRRRAGTVTGAIEYADGTSEEITRASIAATPERALRLLSFALPLLGAALVVARI
jgi:hypothetical protein